MLSCMRRVEFSVTINCKAGPRRDISCNSSPCHAISLGNDCRKTSVARGNGPPHLPIPVLKPRFKHQNWSKYSCIAAGEKVQSRAEAALCIQKPLNSCRKPVPPLSSSCGCCVTGKCFQELGQFCRTASSHRRSSYYLSGISWPSHQPHIIRSALKHS